MKRFSTPQGRQAFLDELRSLGPGDECVYWPWSDKRTGYTRIYVNHQKVNAHRWVFEQLNGPLPVVPHMGPRRDSTQVCHTCDNPPCVRPSHLFPGTNTDNIRDAMTKGRATPHGAALQRRWLTREQVREVRLLNKAGVSQQRIADVLEVPRMTVNRIVNGHSYRDQS